jgi:hypothetical protein
MKEELLVRFANESLYYKRIEIDLEKIKNVLVFPNEVFFSLDDIRVAIKKEDWNNLQEKYKEWKITH